MLYILYLCFEPSCLRGRWPLVYQPRDDTSRVIFSFNIRLIASSCILMLLKPNFWSCQFWMRDSFTRGEMCIWKFVWFLDCPNTNSVTLRPLPIGDSTSSTVLSCCFTQSLLESGIVIFCLYIFALTLCIVCSVGWRL